MKILIGTPVHISKDYSMKKWLENVSKIDYTADLLLVDNSPSNKYMDKLKHYCENYNLQPKIMHLDIDQKVKVDIRIQASQETIRQYCVDNRYDAWLSWECDQIIPPDALSKLVKIMKSQDYSMVTHNSWGRQNSSILNINMGLTLFNKNILKKIYFLPRKNGKISLEPSDSYDIHDSSILKRRILQAGGNYIEVYGIIKPIYHLAK